jgi:hypothetical protein
MMTLPAPYYQDDAVQIFHARCEDILPLLDLSEVACVLADGAEHPLGGEPLLDAALGRFLLADLG